MPKIYSVVMNKGGVGKTTAITNLSGALHVTQPDKKVLLIDTDAQSNSALSFGINTQVIERTIYDALIGKCNIEDVIINIENNLDIVPANDDMNTIDFTVLTDLEKYPKPLFLLRDVIGSIVEEYDYIFIDTPPSLGLVTGNVLAVTDRVVIPFHPEIFGVQGLINVLHMIEVFAEKHNPNLEISAVFGSIVDARTGLHSDMLQQARKYCFGQNIYMAETLISRTIKYSNSIAHKERPLVFSDKRSPYFTLLEEITNNG